MNAVSENQVFSVTVDHDLPLSEMIDAGKYDFANNDINDYNFPKEDEGKADLDLVLLHFNREIVSEEAIAEMKKMGMRPATLLELLAFGEKYPEEQRRYRIIALGNVWQSGYVLRHVPCLDEWFGKHALDLCWFDAGWSAGCRFLAVREK